MWPFKFTELKNKQKTTKTKTNHKPPNSSAVQSRNDEGIVEDFRDLMNGKVEIYFKEIKKKNHPCNARGRVSSWRMPDLDGNELCCRV